MDNMTYHKWWQWHVRVARGETLFGDERMAYQVGLAELDKEEPLAATVDARELRQSLVALQKDHWELEQQRLELDAEITTLESRLSENARQFLGVKK